MERGGSGPEERPPAPAATERGGAAVVLLGAAAVVVVLVLAFLLMGDFLVRGGDEPVQAREVAEGRLSDAAYARVELGTPEDAVLSGLGPVVPVYSRVGLGTPEEVVLSGLRPVVPVYSRVIDRYGTRGQGPVAAQCVYYDRADGRAGQQYRFCLAEQWLVDKTVLLAGDPGEGSAVVQEGL